MLLAVCREFGIDTPDEIFPRIAFGFAGGFGNTGSVCGAVVGAVMAMGLIRGRGEDREGMFARLGGVAEFRRRFEAEMGSISCRELTGLDLGTDQGREELMNSDVAQKACFPAVAAGYRIAVELIRESEGA